MFTDDTGYTEETLPDLPLGREPGWVIPERLRANWNLTLGRSQTELPRLFAEVPEIDVFFHDSDHSMHCTMFEFELAWDWLSSGGILVSDDVSWTDAFDWFVDEREVDGYRLKHPDFGFAGRE